MQHITAEVELLSSQLLSENQRLLRMLARLAHAQPKPKASSEAESAKQPETAMDNKATKDRLSSSRRSCQTLKQSSWDRCESCLTMKRSRQSAQTLSRKKKQNRETRHESNMARLEKLSGLMRPRVGA